MMAGRSISREDALSLQDHKHACHILLYADTRAKLFGKIPIKQIVLMQMRFDGLLGFPGGFVRLSEESLEAGLSRELKEEVGVEMPVTLDDYMHSCLAPAPPRIVLHFYIKKIKEAELIEIEKAAVLNAVDHGLEVLGMVRVPLYTLKNGGGLSMFLSHSFIGNSRDQLLEALRHLGLVSPQTLEEALREAEKRRHDHLTDPH